MKKIARLICFILVFLSVSVYAKPKYVFLFIGDGMSYSHIALCEAARAAKQGIIGFEEINFTQFPVHGFLSTHAINRLISCSAAAGTALACGQKTKPETIAMDSAHQIELKSIATEFKKRNYKVGILSSVSIDHATPAAFYAHASHRNQYHQIAQWLTRSNFDLYAGSGLLQAQKGGVDIYQDLQEKGYTLLRGKEAVLQGEKIYWEQSPDKDKTHIPLFIDAKEDDMQIFEMTQKAVDYLYNPQGFFLMVEGGQIDWAAHENDAASIVKEVESFEKSVQIALDFYEKHPDETLILVTADHETGGLSLGRRETKYNTRLDYLYLQKSSKEKMEKALDASSSWEEAEAILKKQLHVWEAGLVDSTQTKVWKETYYENKKKLVTLLIEFLNLKAGVGFTTGVHTAAYVPLFAKGVCSSQFSGRKDNTDLYKILIECIMNQ